MEKKAYNWEREIIDELYKKYPRREAELFEQVMMPILKAQRKQLIKQFEDIVGEGIDDYFKGLIMIPNPQATKESLKQEIRDKIKEL